MKKTTLFSTFSAIAVSAMMLTAGISANAANMNQATNGVLSLTSSDTSLTFSKDIVIHNDDASVTSVYGPTFTYNYTAAPAEGTELANITDSEGKTVMAKAGPANGILFPEDTEKKVGQAKFTSGSVTLTSGEAVISAPVTLNVDLTKFSGAGVYRYKITESVPEGTTLTSASITRGDNYSSERFLDVYVKNGDEGLEVSAYVMFHLGNGEEALIDGKTETSTILKKTDGFDSEDKAGEGSSSSVAQDMADHYYTYNYTVKKNIVGDLADKTNKFPFTVNTSSGANTGKTFSIKCPDSAVTSGTVGTSFTTGLANGETITIYGLPADAKVSVTEHNNTSDKYKVSLLNPGAEGDEAETLAAGASTGFTGDDAIDLTKYSTNTKTKPDKTYNAATEFTNTLESISPTGVILTAAPYAIMLGIAVFFIAMFLRNKKKDESENTI